MRKDLTSAKNLKIIKISGGLGNQLFQYCFAKATFRDPDDYIIFDISDYFNGKAKRDLVLKNLGLQGHYITCQKSSSETRAPEYLDLTRLTFLEDHSHGINTNLYGIRLVTEKEIAYTPLSQYDLSGNVYLDGYWQSYRYWDEEKNFILKIFTPLAQPLKVPSGKLAPVDSLLVHDICAIHFRRGDYSTAINQQYHGWCEPDYYMQAMRLMGAKQFHVYSDDLIEARLVFGDMDNVKIMGGLPCNEIDDFKSLMQYSMLIISNSSFSYLAAYFAYASHHAKVIAPYPWYTFKNTGPDIPKDWLTLNRATGASPQEEACLITQAKISVVIPVHVRHQYMIHAVTSALNQTLKPIEIILSLNRASDLACNEAKRIVASFNTVRIIEASTASLSLARNAGIHAAIGEYIAFLDDDDIWEPQKLEVQIYAAITMSADLVATNYYKFDASNNQYFISNLSSHRSDLWKFELSVTNCLSGGSAVLMHREIFNTTGYFDESMPSCEDHDMWRRVAIAGFKIHFIDECLTGYRMNTDNMTGKPHLMLQGELIHLSKILSEEVVFKGSAKKFYERIQGDLNQYLGLPEVSVQLHELLSANTFPTIPNRFFYLRKIRKIISTGCYVHTWNDFFFKNNFDNKKIASRLFTQFIKANKILFFLLPVEIISYFFVFLRRIKARLIGK